MPVRVATRDIGTTVQPPERARSQRPEVSYLEYRTTQPRASSIPRQEAVEKMRPLEEDLELEERIMGPGDDFSGDEENEQVDAASPRSANDQSEREYKELRAATWKGAKKEVEIKNIKTASKRIARDANWGPLETRDGREAYAPEVGQRGYDIPEDWVEDTERSLALTVYAPRREWANYLMTPTYASLTVHKPLTNNFRMAYLAVTHDCMLRRLKKAAYLAAKEAERRKTEAFSMSEEDEDQDQPEEEIFHPMARDLRRPEATSTPVVLAQAGGTSQMALGQNPQPNDERDYREFKKIKDLIRPKKDGEEIKDYLKEVWELVENNSENDGAKRMWLTHITSHNVDHSEPARNHYKRIVCEDLDEEDIILEKACTALDQGKTLSQVWHEIKQVIPPSRYIKVLRTVMNGRRGELGFQQMSKDKTTEAKIEKEVEKWDIAEKWFHEKRKHGAQQQKKTEKPEPKATPQPAPRKPATEPPPSRRSAPEPTQYRRFAPEQRQRWGPERDQAPYQRSPAEPHRYRTEGPGPRRTGPPPPRDIPTQPKRGDYLSPEEYQKLTPE
ncbi:hypothetical protein F2P81_025602 [Scophthalmus maximus]|uniref:Uncharacterized protein n=1 Tax=Scophthalmus maximus TaxID=52904 RepID=A0A6A4RPZ9_SCOMX|nr:hypothetical protein F2P81_025602 [Scophthalmus maximus]